MEAVMFADQSKPGPLGDARLVAQAALVLAEQAYADGNAADAAQLVDMAHRLFGAACEWSGAVGRTSH